MTSGDLRRSWHCQTAALAPVSECSLSHGPGVERAGENRSGTWCRAGSREGFTAGLVLTGAVLQLEAS